MFFDTVLRQGARKSVVLSADFTTLAPGGLASGFGLSTIVRSTGGASVPVYGAANPLIVGIPANQARVARVYGNDGQQHTGLLSEGPIVGQSSPAVNSGSWTVSAGASRSNATGPEGVSDGSTAQRLQVSSGFIGMALLGTASAVESLWRLYEPVCASFWDRSTSGSPGTIAVAETWDGDATADGNQTGLLASVPDATWRRRSAVVSDRWVGSSGQALVVGDGRNLSGSYYPNIAANGPAARAEDRLVAYPMLFQGAPHSPVSGTSALGVQLADGDHYADTVIGAGLVRGRVRIRMRIVMQVSASALRTAGIRALRLLGQEDSALVMSARAQAIAIQADGAYVLFPTLLPDWAEGDVFDIDVTAWAGPSIGTYAVNGGASVSLGTTATLGEWRTEGETVGVIDSAYCVLESLTVDDLAPVSGVSTTRIYCSPAGSGTGTKVSPASLAGAQTLARAVVAAGGRPRVVLRGGRYYLGSTLALSALDSRTKFVRYPGETPMLSGGTILTGWVDDGTGQNVSSVTTSQTRDVWVGASGTTPTRATIARSATQSGWTDTTGGVVSSPAISVARPQDLEVVARNSWEFFVVRVVTVVGTTVTIRALDWTYSQSIDGGGTFSLHGANVIWYQNARELITGAAGTQGFWCQDRSTGQLYYHLRAGEVAGTMLAISGTLEKLVTITGTRSAIAAGIAVVGLTFCETSFVEPLAPGGCVNAGSNYYGDFSNTTTALTMQVFPAAVELTYATGCLFGGCTFTRLGAGALKEGTGTKNNVIDNCVFGPDVGSYGIVLGDSTVAAWTADSIDRCDALYVGDCALSDIGSVYWAGSGITRYQTFNTVIERCEGDALPYAFTSCGEWLAPDTGSTVIRRCKATNFCQKLDDGGAYYAYGLNTGYVLSDSYARVGPVGGMLMAPNSLFVSYFDGRSNGLTTTGCFFESSVLSAPSMRFALVNTYGVPVVNCAVTNNYYRGLNDVNAGYDPTNVVSGNVALSANTVDKVNAYAIRDRAGVL